MSLLLLVLSLGKGEEGAKQEEEEEQRRQAWKALRGLEDAGAGWVGGQGHELEKLLDKWPKVKY